MRQSHQIVVVKHDDLAGGALQDVQLDAVSAVGIAAIFNRPVRPFFSAVISCRMARLSLTIRRAQSSVRSPSEICRAALTN